MQLYNKLSKKERLDLINKAGERRLTLSFYKYHQIKNTTIFRNYLFIEWDKLDVLGRIYIAGEGINAQLSVPSNKMIEFKNSIDNVSFLNGVRLNIAIEHDNEAFLKLKAYPHLLQLSIYSIYIQNLLNYFSILSIFINILSILIDIYKKN